MSGLPGAKGTTVSRFATHAGEPGVIYAANNRGLFRLGGDQDGAGRLWTFLGQAPGLQMAWRRLPAFRSDMERRSAVVSLSVVLPVRRANESLNCLCWQRSSSMSIGFCETE